MGGTSALSTSALNLSLRSAPRFARGKCQLGFAERDALFRKCTCLSFRFGDHRSRGCEPPLAVYYVASRRESNTLSLNWREEAAMANQGTEESWESAEVRLFPSTHIKGEREAEQRATASLLAMIKAVSEFGRSVVRQAGGPAGQLSCFTEVAFDHRPNAHGKTDPVRPDGLIQAVRGKRKWVALVEVKVGNSKLESTQLQNYQRLARDRGFDALVTVSNEPAKPNRRPPTKLARRIRKIKVVHFSWGKDSSAKLKS